MINHTLLTNNEVIITNELEDTEEVAKSISDAARRTGLNTKTNSEVFKQQLKKSKVYHSGR